MMMKMRRYVNVYLHNTSINRVFVSLARCIMCREQKQRKESTGYKNCIKPSVVEVKLNISTQDIRYYQPAKGYTLIRVQVLNVNKFKLQYNI